MTAIRNKFQFFPLFRREVGPAGTEASAGVESRRFRRRSALVFGVLLLALSAFLATTGRYWSEGFHPDEPNIRRWIAQVDDGGRILERAYPSGWFELFRIRFALDKFSSKLFREWMDHAGQNGRVLTFEESAFWRVPGEGAGKRLYSIQDGRNFNTWLYILTVLFLYAACLEAGFHPAAAFASGTFFAASPAPVEFVHYCETDASLLVSMAFFAWLAARAIRKGGAWGVLLAGLAAGFAVSCKFTLFPLVLWCVAGPVAALRGGGPRARRWRGVAALAAAALLAMAAGYLLGTPALWMDPPWYMKALRRASRKTYAEIAVNLGGCYAWGAATVLRCRSLLEAFAERGLVPLLWGVFSWTFWFRRPFRRQLAGIPFLLPVFVPFLVFLCPFVRRQETLPFDLLFAMGAGLPLQWFVFGRAGRPALRPAGRALAVLSVLLGIPALWIQGTRTLGMASCFALRDTRAEAQNWFHDTYPSGEPLFFDSYVTQIARGVPCRAIACGGLPHAWQGVPPETNGIAARYYVENEGFEGRAPIRDPKTGRLFPDVRRRKAAYEDAVLTLREWKVSRKTLLPTFGQPRVRLVAFDRPAPGVPDIPIGFERPIRVIPEGTRLYDAGGLPSLGPVRALHTVGKRSTLHLDPENGPRWLVTRMLGGDVPVRVEREGLFVPKAAELPPGGAVAAVLAPSILERLSASARAHSSMRVRMRGDDQSVHCATFLAASPAEAARTLRLAGDPGAALALLREAEPLGDEGCVEAFLAAAAARVAPEAAWVDAARNALAAADTLAARAASDRTGATLCGVPVGILGDYARLRTAPATLAPGGRLPVWLPAGHYELAIAVSGADFPCGGAEIPARLFEGQTADFTPVSGVSDFAFGAGGRLYSAPLEIAEPQFLRLCGDPAAETPLFEPLVADVEIAWSPVERTLAAAAELRSAFVDSMGVSP